MKYIVHVIDPHGDTALYPFDEFSQAQKCADALKKVSSNVADYINVEPLVVNIEEAETSQDIFEIQLYWEESLFGEKVTSVRRRIHKWDCKDIKVLKSAISEWSKLKSDAEKNDWHFPNDIDWSELPSSDLPTDLDTSYPVWAMDEQGFCLVGNLDEIEHVTEVMEQIND